MKLCNKKTGEIGYLELEKGDDEKYIGFRVYKNDFVYKRYGSLIDLSAEWEDYVPQEPLIIDKYPREAVRNWLYVVGGWAKVRIKYYDTTNTYEFANETGYHIELKCVRLRPCDLAKTYTLDELCGEEEDA